MENKNKEWDSFATFKTGDDTYDISSMDEHNLKEIFNILSSNDALIIKK